MKVSHCDHCGQLAFFENVQCLKCERRLAYLPDLGVVGSLDPVADDPERFTTPIKRAAGRRYKLCRNYAAANVCNWTVPADDPHPFCESCRLTRVIPNLSVPGNDAAWYKVEVAKRRLVYTLMALKLPVLNKTDDPDHGLAFEFLADPSAPGAPKVLTGHADGVITINIAEADDAEREKRRLAMHEPYRTLLGHFRHEIGHYYWDRLVRDDEKVLAGFRDLFGDDREDYGAALKKHYDNGPPADWPTRHISSYATAHAWEDWAETFAHYLHVVDTLETASRSGLSITPSRQDEPAVAAVPDPVDDQPEPFADLLAAWYPLTYVLNNLNRGLGLPDAYPFVLSDPVEAKLRFVHDLVTRPVALPSGAEARV